MSEGLEKRLLEYEESGNYVEDGLLEKAAGALKAQRERIEALEADIDRLKTESETEVMRQLRVANESATNLKIQAEADLAKALADVERLQKMLTTARYQLSDEIGGEFFGSGLDLEIQDALEETSGEQDGS